LFDDSVEISRHRSMHRKEYSGGTHDSLYEKQDYYSRTRKDIRARLDTRLGERRRPGGSMPAPVRGAYDPEVKRGFEKMLERYQRTRNDIKQPIDTHLDDYSPVRSARSSTTYDREERPYYSRRDPESRRKRPFANLDPLPSRRKMRKVSHDDSDDYKRHEPSKSRARKTRAIEIILRKVDRFHAERNDAILPSTKASILEQLEKLAEMKKGPPRPYEPFLPYDQHRHNNVMPRRSPTRSAGVTNTTHTSREIGLHSDGELDDRGPYHQSFKKPRSDIAPAELIRQLARGGGLPNPNPVNKSTQNEVAQLLNLLRCYRVDSTVAQDIYNQLLEIVDIDDFPVVE